MSDPIYFDSVPLVLGGFHFDQEVEGRIEASGGQIDAIVLDTTPELVATHADYLRNKESLKGLVWRGLHDTLARDYADEINATAEPYRKMSVREFV